MIRKIGIYWIVISTFIFGLSGCAGKHVNELGQTVSSTDVKLATKLIKHYVKEDLSKYIGKNVGMLVDDNKYNRCYFVSEPPGVLSSLNVYYSDDLYIEIFAKSPLKYTTGFSEKFDFSLNTYKKEQIVFVSLFFKEQLIKQYE